VICRRRARIASSSSFARRTRHAARDADPSRRAGGKMEKTAARARKHAWSGFRGSGRFTHFLACQCRTGPFSALHRLTPIGTIPASPPSRRSASQPPKPAGPQIGRFSLARASAGLDPRKFRKSEIVICSIPGQNRPLTSPPRTSNTRNFTGSCPMPSASSGPVVP
jgi:hypothetical protein